ncbi:MAG TPA: Rieske (2Fe-2S) protein [Cyanobacteria bacterium UBA11372]|nr:Rieske (2Fe-2S) protein [Cyanobacteria bacterium UBA11372]
MNPILPGAPWLIAHKSMLGINQPNKITLNGQDYVLWQNEKREVFALDNVCPHMQAPLSDGWICKERNTIACPFHALEFDGQGRFYQEGKQDVKPVAKPLEIIIVGDCIWTYGGYEPRIPVPDLIPRISQGFQFLGVTGEKSINGDFLTNIKINYDYNHQNGTHREVFKIKGIEVSDYEENGYCTKLVQKVIKDDNSLGEILANPALLTLPKNWVNQFEYAFPALTSLILNISLGQAIQIHVLYPETENRTKTFIILFGKFKHPILTLLLKNSFLKAAATVIEQDTKAIESLYPIEKPKIRLPNEEIMFYAEKLYRDW